MSFGAAATKGSGPLVEVDNYPYAETSAGSATIYTITPYRQRRSTFGVNVAVGTAGYVPNFVKQGVDGSGNSASYGTSGLLFGGSVRPQFNAPFGSLALEVAGGSYSVSGANGSSGVSASLYSGGLMLILNTLFPEPYVAPYASYGYYLVDSSVSAQGTAPYWSAGLLLQLNWVEPRNAMRLYEDIGLENSFLYAEARTWMAASGTGADYSCATTWAAGLSLEF